MEKYVCLVEKVTESMAGCNVQIVAKFGSNKAELNGWAKNHVPGRQSIILENTREINKFFETSSLLGELYSD